MSATTRSTAHRLGIMTIVAAMIAALLALVTAPAALAAPTVIASDLTGGAPVGLISYTPDPSTPFTSAGDGFEIYQRGVSGSIPFAVLDDSLVTFPADTLGIIDDNNLDRFFGATDTVNDDTAAPVSASWLFDVSGASNLTLSADIGAMGDFEAADLFMFEYSVDGAPSTPLWTLVADEAATHNYVMAGGAVVPLDDPLKLGGATLSNNLITFTSALVGTGSTLEVTFTAQADGGSEAVVFQNLIVRGELAPVAPTAGDIVITEIMQNPAAVGDNAGEWVELYNSTGSAIDLDGWTFEDLTGSHVINASVVVPAGGYVVLGNNGDSGTNGGVTVDHVFSGVTLNNGGETLTLSAPGPVVIDSVSYDDGATFPDPNGASMSLDPSTTDSVSNDLGSNWCEGKAPYGAGDLGTPGAANPPCSGVAAGDIIITEIIQNPGAVGDSNGEWFEVYNTTSDPIDLDGWTIKDDGSNIHVITSSVAVPAGGYAVLGINADSGTNGGVSVDYEYSNFFLGNSDDEVVLLDTGDVEIDRVNYDGGPNFPDPNGASMSLDPGSLDAASNDDGANWCTATSSYGLGDLGTPGAENDQCNPPPLTLISAIQGTGSSVAINTDVEVQAIVTAKFTRDDGLDGFFVQEEDSDWDGDPLTSEGIFVFCRATCPAEGAINPGDHVTLVGTPTDFFGMSQLDVVSGSITINSSGNPLPTPTAVDLPAPDSTWSEGTFEHVEGMLVEFSDTLVVSEYFELARYGQIVLTETERPYQYTHSNTPDVTGYAAFLADLATRQIILDDDNNDQNDNISDGPDEVVYYPEGGLSTGNKFRGGDTIDNLTGVLHWSFAGQFGTDAWRIRPIPDVYDYTFDSVNPEPGAPADVGGDITVASFNVLNYFMTIDETSSNSSGPCGPSLLDCRGADSEAERLRQRDKLVAALSAIDADIVGLVELENDDDDAAAADLVAGLNDVLGAGTYAYIATGFIGEDAIKVGAIYKPGAVSPEGAYAILDSSVDSAFIDTKNRPSLIQTFSENATGEKLTIAVNHFKSKGSACDDVGDFGLNDGQANCPGTRAAAASALVNYLNTDPTGSGDDRFMILGDLNAYAKEDAIANLEAGGYTNLMAAFNGPDAYSYLFSAQLGYLDYALANDALLGSVTGVTEWHINADEVPLFDYNDETRDAGEASFERESTLGSPYAPNALRSSDHDPVIVGLNLANPMGDKEDLLASLNGMLPSGDDHTDKHLERAIKHLEHSLNPDYWTSDQTINNRKVFDEEKKTVKELWRAVHHGILDATVAEDAMDTLVAADELLARIALISAADRDVKQKDIDKAEEEMVKAANYWADGNFSKAIDNYKKAWEKLNKKTHTPL